MAMFKKVSIAVFSLMPVLAIAHAGHDHHYNSLLNGFVHPFTGLDHFMMLLAFAVLIGTSYQRWKTTGLISLLVAMLTGFAIGSQAIISIATAESGIILSLVLLAVGLWTKSNKVVPVLAVLLASFHGAAHGVELGQSGHVALLMLGMLSAMSLIYITGLALATFMQKYLPYGKQIVAAITTVVAVICIA